MEEIKKYTLQSIGEALNLHIAKDTDRDTKINGLYQDVVTGNGHPSLKSEVERHSRWIDGVNKFIWIFVTAIIGQFVTIACGLSAVIYMLVKGVAP
jgi:hypothetical protein